ncbi:MAG: hypothetical protein IKU72_05495 [Oscillospiraceae bacterium]|nr:hypothetical protein [Oscillospiraceae bacterium]
MCLYGCGAAQPSSISLQQAQTALAQPMQAELSIKAADFSAKGQLERTGPEMYSFTFTQPEELEGLCIRVEQQECLLSYQGMELKLQTDLLPANFALKALNHALDEMMHQDSVSLQNTADGGGILTGKADGSSFEIRLDDQCLPESFAVTKHNLVITWITKTE